VGDVLLGLLASEGSAGDTASVEKVWGWIGACASGDCWILSLTMTTLYRSGDGVSVYLSSCRLA